MGQPIERHAGRTLGGKHAGPLVDQQVEGDDSRAPLVALAEYLEQQLGNGASPARAGRQWKQAIKRGPPVAQQPAWGLNTAQERVLVSRL